MREKIARRHILSTCRSVFLPAWNLTLRVDAVDELVRQQHSKPATGAGVP
jgi:hypothetical protein